MLAKLAEMVLRNLPGVLYPVFFEHALEYANERTSVMCGRLIPSVLHVLDEPFARRFEIRDGNDAAGLVNRLTDSDPRRGSEIKQPHRRHSGRGGPDNIFSGNRDLQRWRRHFQGLRRPR